MLFRGPPRLGLRHRTHIPAWEAVAGLARTIPRHTTPADTGDYAPLSALLRVEAARDSENGGVKIDHSAAA